MIFLYITFNFLKKKLTIDFLCKRKYFGWENVGSAIKKYLGLFYIIFYQIIKTMDIIKPVKTKT